MGTRSFIGLSEFTSEGSHESFNGTARTSQRKISIHARVNSDCESKADHDEPGHSQVHQDEVEWLPKLLVLHCYQQCQEVDWETSADEEKYVEAQHFEEYGICQIILRIFKRTPHEPRPVVHGDVKVPAFCAILHFGGSEMRWLVQNQSRGGVGAASLNVMLPVYVPLQKGLQGIKKINQEDKEILIT